MKFRNEGGRVSVISVMVSSKMAPEQIWLFGPRFRKSCGLSRRESMEKSKVNENRSTLRTCVCVASFLIY